jgi:sec-independent protein translocase protein TatA
MEHFVFAWLPHGSDWMWIALVVLVLFGADKLPKLARGLGKSLGEFKKAKDEFEKEIHTAASETETKKLDDKNAGAAMPTSSAASVDEPAKKS